MGQSFRDLIAWQKAIALTLAIYKLTESFPPSERFGLTDQLRRAAVSVGSNCEVETQLVIVASLGYG